MKYRGIYWRRYEVPELLYIRQWHLSPLQSRHLGTSVISPSISSTVQNTLKNPLLELPSAALLNFPESHWWSQISSLAKVILVWGKPRSLRVPNLGCRGAESPVWFDASPTNSARDVMHEQAHCCSEVANLQLPVAAAILVILQLNWWRTLR